MAFNAGPYAVDGVPALGVATARGAEVTSAAPPRDVRDTAVLDTDADTVLATDACGS